LVFSITLSKMVGKTTYNILFMGLDSLQSSIFSS